MWHTITNSFTLTGSAEAQIASTIRFVHPERLKQGIVCISLGFTHSFAFCQLAGQNVSRQFYFASLASSSEAANVDAVAARRRMGMRPIHRQIA